jgi:oligoendopeptidase F
MPQLIREQVPVELTWNLDDIYPSPADWEVDVAQVQTEIETVTRFRGTLGGGSDAVLRCLQARDRLAERLLCVSAYASLAVSTDGTSAHYQAMSARASMLGATVDAELSFLESELIALPDGTIERYLASDPGLGTYRKQLEDVLRKRVHVLSPETEEVLAALGETLGASALIWQRTTSADLVCPSIQTTAGEEIPVSIARYVFGLSQSPDRETRHRAFDALAAGLNRHKNGLATTLATTIQRNVKLARLRRYDSAEEMILAPQQVPLAVYHNVLDAVHDEIAPHVRRLIRLRQRVLGLDQVYRYDLEAPLDPGFEPTATFEETDHLVQEGLAVLGPEYAEIVRAAFRDRWIDRADNVGKRSGAFCWSVYGVHPYVFTTWQDNLRSAFIVAHELGHAGHGTLAGRSQVLSNTRTELFFVEAPSTANELILGQHLLATTTDPRLRRWIIGQFLGTFTHNMVTHLLEGHFERRLYQVAEADKPITLKVVLDTQAEVFERFYRDSVVPSDADRLYWSQQPHFYRGLYPYTYAAGLACGYGVAEAIGAEGQPAVDRWLATLRAGGTRPPLELMRQAGVDLATPEPLRRAVAFFGRLVDELERSFG